MPRVAPTVALIPAPRPLFVTDQLCEACGDGGAEDSQVVCENGDPAKHTGWVSAISVPALHAADHGSS